MDPRKTPMPEQPPQQRIRNFDEVATGYTEEMAIREAKRCLQCKHPHCMAGCPVQVQIPEFIAYVAEGKFREAYEKIVETNALPAVCGRVCPQENQCEKRCVRGIRQEPVGIGRLERFVADWYLRHKEDKAAAPFQPNGHAVAVLGAGPAGLTCAGDLAKLGYCVTVFEALHEPGGVLVYGIPEFRLPKAIVAEEVDRLRELGVDFRCNSVAGKSFTLDDLFDDGFEAVFIGTGAGLPSFLNIEGESLNGVYSANEYLTRTNLMKAFDAAYDTPMIRAGRVVVVGGGNVAMDAARSARRLGAEVTIVYRRGRDELPARAEEAHHAQEEGVQFRLLSNPVRILGNDEGWVTGVACVQMELGEPDASGRRRPVEIPDSHFTLPADAVIVAVGTSPNPLLKNATEALATDRRGHIVADEETCATSIPGVFAGGDAVTGAATVILAMGAGKDAATAIDRYIRAKAEAPAAE